MPTVILLWPDPINNMISLLFHPILPSSISCYFKEGRLKCINPEEVSNIWHSDSEIHLEFIQKFDLFGGKKTGELVKKTKENP